MSSIIFIKVFLIYILASIKIDKKDHSLHDYYKQLKLFLEIEN